MTTLTSIWSDRFGPVGLIERLMVFLWRMSMSEPVLVSSHNVPAATTTFAEIKDTPMIRRRPQSSLQRLVPITR
jgi:hypothetical protein